MAPSRATTPAGEAPGGRHAGGRDDALATDQPGAATEAARIVGAPVRAGAGLTGKTGSPLDRAPDAVPGRQLDLPATSVGTGSTAGSTPPLSPSVDARDSSARPERASPASAPRPSSRTSEARAGEPAFSSTGASGRPPPEPAAPLRDELTVLRQAKAQHDAGDFAAALTSLDAYDTRFPGGVMAVESQVLRVLTLCELGRQPDARAVLVALQRKTPKSPAVTRLKTSCAAE
jgi:TolA-binding protein